MNKLLSVSGYWQDEPEHVFHVLVSPDKWKGDENDNHVFFYMDGAPLQTGDIIADDFCVLTVEEA